MRMASPHPAQTYPYPAPYGVPYPTVQKGFHAAQFLFWFIFWFLTICVSIGLTWDRQWHTQHVFDTFFSPPHLFVYSTVAIAGVLAAVVTYVPTLRQWFGPTFRFALFPFAVPGALFILGAGFVTLLLAGGLDSLWHSNFGLDETGWSTPHAMIGWGLLMIYLGFTACYLALRTHKAVTGFARVTDTLAIMTLMYFALSFSFTPFTGPIGSNIAPVIVYAISRYPIILAQPPAQHTYRIYLAWNLTRTNPLFVPLCALWAGAVLAFIRRLDPRAWLSFVALGIWTLLQFSGRKDALILARAGNLSTAHLGILTLPVPIIVAALVVVVLLACKLDESWAWLITGLIFGFLVALIWTGTPQRPLWLLVLPLVAAPVMLVGAEIGKIAFTAVAQPAAKGRAAIVLVGVAVPLLVGMIDLYLRLNTP